MAVRGEGAAGRAHATPRQDGPGFRYTIPLSALGQLSKMNRELDPRGRYDAVMKADELFEVAPAD